MVKLVNNILIRVEIIEHWQYFKIYKMFLAKYLRPDKMELFKKEIEFSTKIALKAIPQ